MSACSTSVPIQSFTRILQYYCSVFPLTEHWAQCLLHSVWDFCKQTAPERWDLSSFGCISGLFCKDKKRFTVRRLHRTASVHFKSRSCRMALRWKFGSNINCSSEKWRSLMEEISFIGMYVCMCVCMACSQLSQSVLCVSSSPRSSSSESADTFFILIMAALMLRSSSLSPLFGTSARAGTTYSTTRENTLLHPADKKCLWWNNQYAFFHVI